MKAVALSSVRDDPSRYRRQGLSFAFDGRDVVDVDRGGRQKGAGEGSETLGRAAEQFAEQITNLNRQIPPSTRHRRRGCDPADPGADDGDGSAGHPSASLRPQAP